jgi:hypothetical protein
MRRTWADDGAGADAPVQRGARAFAAEAAAVAGREKKPGVGADCAPSRAASSLRRLLRRHLRRERRHIDRRGVTHHTARVPRPHCVRRRNVQEHGSGAGAHELRGPFRRRGELIDTQDTLHRHAERFGDGGDVVSVAHRTERLTAAHALKTRHHSELAIVKDHDNDGEL